MIGKWLLGGAAIGAVQGMARGSGPHRYNSLGHVIGRWLTPRPPANAPHFGVDEEGRPTMTVNGVTVLDPRWERPDGT